ncbi:MAG TPA: DUF4349 domain-containing protein [Actinomycetota bacterium]|nr:DUF4349 domain-containing protein [Actinomycetota bacterium]
MLARTGTGTRSARGIFVALLLVIGVAAAACGSGAGGSAGGGAVRGPASPAPGEPGEPAGGEAPGRDLDVALAGPLPAIGARIVKTASLAVEVEQGAFSDRFERVSLIAGRFGGYVSSSSVSGTEERGGTIVIRVPAVSFERALADLRRLGEVTEEEISGEDVTDQFVDLEARLRNWRAQEAVLLDLMERARTIRDTITVQNQLQQVQLTIEEIQGQLRLLDDRTSLSTISIVLTEPGAAVPKPGEGPSIGRAWRDALDGFLAVIAAVIVGLGYAVPLALMALLVWVVVRRQRPRPAAAG